MLSVTASETKQSPGLQGDCFVAKNAPTTHNLTRHSCRNQTATLISTTFARSMQMLHGNTIISK